VLNEEDKRWCGVGRETWKESKRKTYYELLHAAELGVGAGTGVLLLLSRTDGSISSRVNIFHLLRTIPAQAIH
jgi:hypothetical protein